MKEHSLTIADIEWKDGNIYETSSGEKFLVRHKALIHYNTPHFNITDAYLLKDILNKKFRKIIDWSKVPVDTKILVQDSEDDAWERRYFAEYADGEIYAWHDGKTSWSAKYPYNMCSWNYAKLATEEE